MKKILIILGVVLFLGLGSYLIFTQIIDRPKGPVNINLQITEYRDPEALIEVINQLETRGITPATVFVGQEFVEENCDQVRDLDEKGYEIAAFGYALGEAGDFIQLENLTKEEQEGIIIGTKTAIESCLGKSISGYRSQRFSKNDDTLQIVSDLGFMWHGSYIAGREPGVSLLPEYSEDHGFYVVSIESAEEAETVICDTAMSASGKTAEEWNQAVKQAFLRHQRDGTPFVTEIHPYFLIDSGDWEEEFIDLIDWLEDQQVDFLTTQQMIIRFCEICVE